MASNITLSAGVRQNLLSLQGTADLMSQTQNRLATGKKVNSALDNPTNFFTSSSLQSRAGDMSALLDSMSNGIKTLEAADNGLSSITDSLESMQSTLRQARQDKSFKTASYTLPTSGLGAGETIGFSGGAVGETAVEVNLTKGTGGTSTAQNAFASAILDDAGDSITFDVAVDGGAVQTVTFSQATVTAAGGNATDGISIDEAVATINSQLNGATASNNSGSLRITSDSLGTSSSVAVTNFAATDGGGADTLAGTEDFGFGTPVEAAGAVDGGEAKTVDELVAEINSKTLADGTTANPLNGTIRASNDNGKLRIENLSTQELTVDGVSAAGAIDGTSTGASTIDGNTVRADLATQFNELRDQLDKFSDDASFNGINLLRGDNLKLTFNETGTSSIDIQTKDAEAINSANLGLNNIEAENLDSDANIDVLLDKVKTALGEIRSQSSSFGSNLSVVENRTQFTKSMVNTLQTGADALVLADTNEEAANMLALQTRQQLSSTALSMASQADQAVLRLF